MISERRVDDNGTGCTGMREQTNDTRTTTEGVGRRGVVLAAGAIGAVGAAVMLAPAARASAASGEKQASEDGVGVASIAPLGGYRAVLGPADAVKTPTALAFAIRGALAAGTRLQVAYDSRVHQPFEQARLHVDGRLVSGVAVTVRAGRGSRATLEVVVPQGLPAGREWVVDAGSARPLRYPDDLIADPEPVVVTVLGRGSRQVFPLAPVAAAAAGSVAPWGARLSAAWDELVWGAGLHVSHPRLITMHAVGPGPIPAGTLVRVRLDARVVADATLRPLDDDSSPSSARKASRAGGIELEWESRAALPTGSSTSLLLDVTARASIGASEGLEAASAWIIAPESGRGDQRFTGAESITSLTDVTTDADARALAPR